MKNTERKAYNLPQIIAVLATIETLEDIYSAGAIVDKSFDAGKITARDHENLYKIINNMPYRKG